MGIYQAPACLLAKPAEMGGLSCALDMHSGSNLDTRAVRASCTCIMSGGLGCMVPDTEKISLGKWHGQELHFQL